MSIEEIGDSDAREDKFELTLGVSRQRVQTGTRRLSHGVA
jgi:hypothetical protein